MPNRFAKGCCGLSPRNGSLVASMYMMLVCVVQGIFERGHLRNDLHRLSCDRQNGTINETLCTPVTIQIILDYRYVEFTLLGITFFMSFILLLSVHLHLPNGMFTFVAWICFYEVANIVIFFLAEFKLKSIGFAVHIIEWVGLVLRICLHFFWLVYVMTHALEISNKKWRFLPRRKKIPKSKQKSKISSKVTPKLKVSIAGNP